MTRVVEENIGPCECCGEDICCPSPPAAVIATVVVLTGGPCTVADDIDGHETRLEDASETQNWVATETDPFPTGSNCGFDGIDSLDCTQNEANPLEYRLGHQGLDLTATATCDPFYLEFGPYTDSSECCTGPEEPNITYKVVITEAP